jgi:small-conductance mechanosensitive channel
VNPPPDDAIQRRIEGILSALGGTEGIEVQVQNGIVRLEGRAESIALREQAGELAGRVDGVVTVQNRVHAASDVKGRLAPTWLKVKGVLADVLGFLPVLAVALGAFLLFALLSSLVARAERPFQRLGLSRLGANVLRIALRVVLLTAGLVVTLDILGLAAFVGTLVGALGLMGVVAGIALRDVIANYLPGIMLGLNPPFAPGDHVQIGAHEGRVVRVTSRETILVENDGQHLRIPNVRLLQEPIVNFERHRERRLQVPIDVALSTDLRRVRDVGLETLPTVRGILRKPRPFMRVLGIQSDRVRVAFFAWADQQVASFHDLESGARQAVKEALLTASVTFPTQQIAVHRAGAAVEGGERDDPEEGLLETHVREEQAEPGERDLLSEGRSPPP